MKKKNDKKCHPMLCTVQNTAYLCTGIPHVCSKHACFCFSQLAISGGLDETYSLKNTDSKRPKRSNNHYSSSLPIIYCSSDCFNSPFVLLYNVLECFFKLIFYWRSLYSHWYGKPILDIYISAATGLNNGFPSREECEICPICYIYI